MPIYRCFSEKNYLQDCANWIVNQYQNNLHDVDIIVPDIVSVKEIKNAIMQNKEKIFFLPYIFPLQEIQVVNNSIIYREKYETIDTNESLLIIAKYIRQISKKKNIIKICNKNE